MDLTDWLRGVTGVTGVRSPEAVEAVWDAWLAGEDLSRVAEVAGVDGDTVRAVLRSRPPASFGLRGEPVSGDRALWFAVEGLIGADGENQPMAFLVPPRLYAVPVLRRACALVSRSLALTRPGATACWDIVEDVDHETCSVMARRGFLVWSFDQDGEIRAGT